MILPILFIYFSSYFIQPPANMQEVCTSFNHTHRFCPLVKIHTVLTHKSSSLHTAYQTHINEWQFQKKRMDIICFTGEYLKYYNKDCSEYPLVELYGNIYYFIERFFLFLVDCFFSLVLVPIRIVLNIVLYNR